MTTQTARMLNLVRKRRSPKRTNLVSDGSLTAVTVSPKMVNAKKRTEVTQTTTRGLPMRQTQVSKVQQVRVVKMMLNRKMERQKLKQRQVMKPKCQR